MKTKIVCKKCGSENVEAKIWHNLLTDENSLDYLEEIEDEDTWCLDCQTHSGIEFTHSGIEFIE